MQRFRLVDAQGKDLGPFVAKTARWKPGDRIYRGSEGDLIVMRMIKADVSDNADGYLVVEQAPWFRFASRDGSQPECSGRDCQSLEGSTKPEDPNMPRKSREAE